MSEVEHPAHYGGAENPYEAIKIIDAYDLNFCLGNVIKYLLRAGRKPGVKASIDLRKALWYLNHEVERIIKEEQKEDGREVQRLYDSLNARRGAAQASPEGSFAKGDPKT